MATNASVRPFIDLSSSDVARFVKRLPVKHIPDLGAFRDQSLFQETVQHVRDSFPETLRKAEESLEAPGVAAAVIRFPSVVEHTPQEEALLNAVIAVSVGGAMTTTSIDARNGTPFTVSKSTPVNHDKLESAGLGTNDLEDLHGFHNDVRIDPATEDVFVPDRIVLHNIYIGFRKPGDLIWVPYQRWSAFQEYQELFGAGRPYLMNLTPDAHEGDDLDSFAERKALIPVFSRAPGRSVQVCVAGKISGSPDGMDPELPHHLQLSLSECPGRIAIPQTTRQVVVLSNKYGFHGRDTFANPTDGVRVLLRMMDGRGARVGQSSQRGEHALLR